MNDQTLETKAPEVTLTQRALQELELIIENDFTLKGKYFRIVISGKKCAGFTYSVGFTDLEENDLQIQVQNENSELEVLIDPFAAFYLGKTTIDFVQNFESGEEGFVVNTDVQDNFTGKFWKKDQTKVPTFNLEVR